MSDDLSPGSFFASFKVKLAGGLLTLLVGLALAFFQPWMDKAGRDFASAQPVAKAQAPPAADSGGIPPSSDRAEQPSELETAPSPARISTTATEPAPETARQPRIIRNEITVPHFESSADVEYLESTGTGTGKDRETAVFHALEEALSKHGAQISAEVQLQLLTETKRLNESKTRKVDQSLVSDIKRLTDGLVCWWDIRTEEDDGRKCSVEVAAVIAKIKTQASQHPTRKTLAVLPFKLDTDASIKGRTVAAAALGAQFRESTVTYLVNSRKFAVLDKTFAEELKVLATQEPTLDPTQKAITAARQLGAEYAIIGLATGLGVDQRRVGELDVPVADGVVNLRVIRVDTRQTVLASAFKVADLRGVDLSGGHPENSMADALGRVMSERILETIYPLKVAALNGTDEVILNRGGDDLALGQRLDLCNPGEELKDPSTGEFLGVAEAKVATIEVTRVLPKVSYARVVSRTADILVEAVCRKPQLPPTEPKPKQISARTEIDNLFK
jgi:hypothetical protein